MDQSEQRQLFPRPLSGREREWIEWVLPKGRPEYERHLDRVNSMVVIGEGRRGKGEIILGRSGTSPDFSAPLAPVLAYGAIETNQGTISLTLREMFDDQISIEIVSHRAEEIPANFEEVRRWTYSTWTPGEKCPQCLKAVREIPMHTVDVSHELLVLAICPTDRRLWVYDSTLKVNRLIPVTNYYNELMLHKNIRDPQIALDSQRLFTHLSEYSDSDLTYAFLTYNKIKTKVHVGGSIAADREVRPTLRDTLGRIFTRKRS